MFAANSVLANYALRFTHYEPRFPTHMEVRLPIFGSSEVRPPNHSTTVEDKPRRYRLFTISLHHRFTMLPFLFVKCLTSLLSSYAGRFTLYNLQGTFIEGSLERAKGEKREGKTLAFSNGNLNLVGVSVGRHPKRRSESRESYQAYVPIESSRRGLEGRERKANRFVWCELI